jgi:hypothetical protein
VLKKTTPLHDEYFRKLEAALHKLRALCTPRGGTFIDKVRDLNGKPLVIDGLWALQVGNGFNGDLNNTKFGLFDDPICPKLAITLSGKGLAFGRQQSGTRDRSRRDASSGSCPAGCMAEVGLRWWRQ